MPITSREIRLVSRPRRIPTVDNFTLVETELKPIEDQQVLVRNLYMSVDPYMRGRMNDSKTELIVKCKKSRTFEV
jgi:NADPH-dependent curcumin reductase CurA